MLCFRSVDLQRRAGVALRGIQRVDPAVAVVVGSRPHLVSQLEGDTPPAGGNVLSVPQVHLTAEIKHQDLDTHTHSYYNSQVHF